LRELTGGKRNRLFMFNDYVRLFVRGSTEQPDNAHEIRP